MRRVSALTLAILSLAVLPGCRLFEKSKDRGAEPASRSKDKDKDWVRDRQDRGPPDNWLDTTPSSGKGSRVPSADPASDPKKAASRVLSGTVEDEYGKPIANAYITVENADPIKAGYGAPMGVESNREGYFEINGLIANEHYMLACTVGTDKKLGGRLSVQVPNTRIKLKLREDYTPPPARTPSDLPPPPSVPSRPETPAAAPKPDDWSPVPTTPTPVPRGDLVAPGPPNDWKPPTATIPGPPPSPTIPPPGSSSKSMPRDAKYAVLDDTGRPRNVLSGRPEDLVLLDFVSSTCVPCKKAIPVLVAFHEKQSRNVELIAVLCDNVKDGQRVDLANKYRVDNRLPYPVYADGKVSVADALKVEYYPTLVLLDGTGRRLWKGSPRELSEVEKIIRNR